VHCGGRIRDDDDNRCSGDATKLKSLYQRFDDVGEAYGAFVSGYEVLRERTARAEIARVQTGEGTCAHIGTNDA